MRKIWTKTTEISNIHKILNYDNSVENKYKKIFLIPYSTLDGLSNDTTHNSTMNKSIGQNWLNKKTHFSI